jgi:nicotinamidase-related amidase
MIDGSFSKDGTAIAALPFSNSIGFQAVRVTNGSRVIMSVDRSVQKEPLANPWSLEISMAGITYERETTALLVVDPYNDFISEGGPASKLSPKPTTASLMLEVLNATRKAKLRVFYAMHHRYRPGDYETWRYVAPIQKAAWQRKSFEYGTWGGEFRAEFVPEAGEIVAAEHWCSSGFANTDLDLQLKKHGIHQLIVIGLIAHTCIEATVRYAAELGYDVTVVKDATADYSDEMMHAALDINLPNYASAVVTTEEIVGSISSL